jgi:protein CMS1
MSIEDHFEDPLLEGLSPSPEPDESAENRSSSKRKREPELEQSSKKAAKKRKSKKSKAVYDDQLDVELGINNAFSHMDSQLLADYVAQRTRQYEGDLSLVELEDKYIPGI